MASETVDRVARAICRTGCTSGCTDAECYEFTDWIEDARAAIAAVREPTLEILAIGIEAQVASPQPVLIDVWHSMIDAMLQ